MLKTVLLSDLIKLYFSEYPTIDFTKIKQKAKEINETLKKYPNLAVSSWLKGRAKDVYVSTINFIKSNKHLLSPSKKSFTYQEYHQLLKFKPTMQNLDIFNEEDKKIQSIIVRKYKMKKYRNNLFIFLFFLLFFSILHIYSSISTFVLYISIFSLISIGIYSLFVNLEFRQWFFSLKDEYGEKEELEHQINISNKKICKSYLVFD